MAAIIQNFMSLDDIAPLARAGVPIRWAGWTEENKGMEWPWIVVTADAGVDKFSATAHGLLNGMPVRLAAATTLPAAPDMFASSGDVPLLPDQDYYVAEATANDFKLRASPDASWPILNLSTAGTGALTVRRSTRRQWLLYAHTEWWLVGMDGLPQFCRCNDLTIEELSGSRWTPLSEDCLAERQLDQLVQPGWSGIIKCTAPLGTPAEEIIAPAVVPAEAVVTASTATATTTPEGNTVEGGGSSGGSGDGSSGGRSSGLQGGGNSGGGGSDESGGGNGGGGSGGGGGSPVDTPPEEQPGKVPIDPAEVFDVIWHVALVSREPREGSGQTPVKVTFSFDCMWSTSNAARGELQLLRLRSLINGRQVNLFSGYLHPTQVREGFYETSINVPVGTSMPISIYPELSVDGTVVYNGAGINFSVPT